MATAQRITFERPVYALPPGVLSGDTFVLMLRHPETLVTSSSLIPISRVRLTCELRKVQDDQR
jgi:hypothetical protein